MKKYLQTDESVAALNTHKDLWEYLKFRKENDADLLIFSSHLSIIIRLAGFLCLMGKPEVKEWDYDEGRSLF